MKTKVNWFKINILGIYLLFLLIGLVALSIYSYLVRPYNELVSALMIISLSGGIGGTIYSIRGFYQSIAQDNFDFKWAWWYVFRPVNSMVIGVFVYFLIVGGLLSMGQASEVNYSRGLMFYSAIAFLAGFSFTQFANKLEEIASTIFSKKEKK